MTTLVACNVTSMSVLVHLHPTSLTVPQNIFSYTVVRDIEISTKRSLWGYRGDDWVSFLKITLTDQRSLPKVRDMSSFDVGNCFCLTPSPSDSSRLFERGECRFDGFFETEVSTFESNIAYTLRFMIDTRVCLFLILSDTSYSSKP